MNLKQKIIEIRKEVSFLQKKTEGYNYKYVTEDQVLFAIKDKMDSLGVLLIPSVTSHHVKAHTYKNSYQKEVTENIVVGDMIFTWLDADSDEVLEVPFALYGQQGDASQAFGSGLTYSNRYFLLKFFQVATNESDPDKLRSKMKQTEDKEYLSNERIKTNLVKKLELECADLALRKKATHKTLEDLGFKNWNELHFRDISEAVFIGTFTENVKELK
jgi:hypothetical protein